MAIAVILAVLTTPWISGCDRTHQVPPGHEPVPEISRRFETSLAFLQPGRTTRDEVEARWGASTLSMQSGRVLCYAFELFEDIRATAYHVPKWMETGMATWDLAAHPVFRVLKTSRIAYSDVQVILVFGDDGILEKYQIVKQSGGLLYGSGN